MGAATFPLLRTIPARHLWTVGTVLFSLLLLANPSRAGDTEFGAAISEHGVWDSNPLMRRDHVDEIFGSTTNLRLSLTDKRPATNFSLAGWVDKNLFDQSEFNSTDFHGTTGFTFKKERFDAGVTAKADFDTTRDSEITELGLVTRMVDRTKYSISPQFNYSVAPRDKIGFTSSYDKTSYDDDSYTDFHTFTITPAYQRRLTEKYSGVLSVRARRYKSDSGSEKKVDTVGPSLGLTADITERLKVNAHFGEEATREEVQGVVTRDWDWNYVFSSGLAYEGDQDTLQVSASRSQQSYANGSDRLLTSFSVSEKRALNSSLSLNFGANYRFSEQPDSAAGQLDRAYGGNAGLVYHATQSIDVSTAYKYRNELLTGSSKEAQQNVVRLGLTYRQNIDLVSK